MNKTELIERTVQRASIDVGVTRNQVEHTLNHALDVIREELAEGRIVNLTGFGKFDVRQTKARTGRNPRTGEPVAIPAGKRVRFVAGKRLAEAVED